jgi:predicted transcriptional regulator
MNFKNYLINENKTLFAQRVGDILNSLQTISEDPKKLDKKEKIDIVVSQIRSNLLKGNQRWKKLDEELKSLIKIGVNLSKSVDPKIENKPELELILKASINELQKILDNLGMPINQL